MIREGAQHGAGGEQLNEYLQPPLCEGGAGTRLEVSAPSESRLSHAAAQQQKQAGNAHVHFLEEQGPEQLLLQRPEACLGRSLKIVAFCCRTNTESFRTELLRQSSGKPFR